jgi:hypothetical protein
VVTVVSDALDEVDETVVLTLGTPTNAGLGATTVHTVTITDDDDPPTVTLAVDSTVLAESGTGPAVVTATLSAVSGLDVTVDLDFSGTATLTDDYTRSGTQFEIPAGSTSGTITLNAVGDALDEPDETVIIEITTVTNGTEATPQQVTVTIVDDDDPPSLSINDVTVTEGATGNSVDAVFTVTLSAASGRTVTVDYATADGTATAPGDYTAIPTTTLTFTAGQNSQQVTVVVQGDDLDEADETFTVNLTNAANATIADGQGLGTITDDDDPPTVEFATASQTVTESVGLVTVTVQLSAVSGLDVTVPFTVGGTATGGGEDYSITASPAVIPAGSLSVNIEITVTDDGDSEPDETIVIDLEQPDNGALGTVTTHTVTISANDGG